MRTSALIIFLTALSSFGKCTASKTDSLLKICQTATSDTNLALANSNLAIHLKSISSDSALIFSSKSLEGSYIFPSKLRARLHTNHALVMQQLGHYDSTLFHHKIAAIAYAEIDYRPGTAEALNNIGVAHYFKGTYDSAMVYFEASGEAKLLLRDSVGAARAFNNTGIMHDIGGQPARALQAYHKALSIYEEAQRDDMILGTLLNIGIIHHQQKSYESALRVYKRSIALAQKTENNTVICNALNNLGSVYDDIQSYDSALTCYNSALELSKKIEYKKGIALSHTNIAVSLTAVQSYESALEHYLIALPLKESLGNKGGIAVTEIGIGEVYMQLGDFVKSIKYAQQALNNAQEIQYVEYIRKSYELLSNAYHKNKSFESALTYRLLFDALKDSILNEENSKIINELNTKYETEQQQQQIKYLQKETELQEAEKEEMMVIIVATAMALLMSFGLAGIIFKNYRQKKKANFILEEKNLQISEQKKELTDSINYAKTIQDAILPSSAEISKYIPHHFVYFQPKDTVSGDFYWFGRARERSVIAAVDCTGHGVPGAFVSMIGANLLNQIVVEQQETDPGEILRLLNMEIRNVFQRKGAKSKANDGMDMALISFEETKQGANIEYAGAKNPLIYIANGELMSIKGTNAPIGGQDAEHSTFETHRLSLKKGDACFLFSDGYQDQFGGSKGKKFMTKQFKSLLTEIHLETPLQQEEILKSTMMDWMRGYEQVDDICVVGISI